MTSMHPFSFSFFSEANSVGIRASAWSLMLTIFREHFRDRTETELNRQSSAGRNGDASERASGTSLCLDLESTALHLRQTREHVFRSWQPSFPNTAYSRSSPLRLDAQTSRLMGILATVGSFNVLASNCPALERMAICNTDTVGDSELAFIAAKFTALKKLCIKNCPISDTGVKSGGGKAALAW